MFFDILESRRLFSANASQLNHDFAAILAAKNQITAAVRNQAAVVAAANRAIARDLRVAHALPASTKPLTNLRSAENRSNAALVSAETRLTTHGRSLATVAKLKGLTFLRKTTRTKALHRDDETGGGDAGSITASVQEMVGTVSQDVTVVQEDEEPYTAEELGLLDDANPDNEPLHTDISKLEEDIGHPATDSTDATGSVAKIEKAVQGYKDLITTISDDLTSLIAPPPPAGEILVNGSFEYEPLFGHTGQSYTTISVMSGREIPGWTIAPGHAVTMHNNTMYPTISGTYSINTDGEGTGHRNADLYQDFQSIISARYTLSFDLAGWMNLAPSTMQEVSIVDTLTGSVLFDQSYARQDGTQHITFNFQGTNNVLRLRLNENPQSTVNDNMFILDNFSVVEVL